MLFSQYAIMVFMKTAYISDPIFHRHDTGTHSESSRRLEAIERAIMSIQHALILKDPILASRAVIETIHTTEMVDQVIDCAASSGAIDADTVCSHASYDAARMAAGAGMVAIDGLVSGEWERAFCAVRPPGHHATPTQSMGFCLFNSIAITARYAQTKGFEKVMIIDFDVHHGNGTQDAFYADDTVFYFSSHQAFAYPGTGMESHRGEGAGEGHTANFLVMPDSGDAEVLEIYHDNLPPLVEQFAPDIILVSAGYDLHESDPLAQLNVTTEGVREIVRSILDTTDVPFVFFLEGGYDVNALGKNVRVTLEEMLA